MKNTSRTNWEALDSMSDDDIDYSDIPPLTDEFFEKAVLKVPATQAKNLVQLDADVMDWFQPQGGEYKNLINSVLRRHIEGGGDKKTA
ncbi:MAG: BrnA antitoxin family protein [Heteroscytonema crispum UTEX LB 1556]